jgi:hypothetical protein
MATTMATAGKGSCAPAVTRRSMTETMARTAMRMIMNTLTRPIMTKTTGMAIPATGTLTATLTQSAPTG